MAKSIVVPFEFPSIAGRRLRSNLPRGEISPDPLTEVIQAGAKELLRTAIQAEVSTFIAEEVPDHRRTIRKGPL